MAKVGMIAKITAASGKRDDVAEQLGRMFPQVDTEEGTELYILHEDSANPDVLWMYELYTDQDALVVHATSPAMGELMGTLGGELIGAPPELISLSAVRAKGIDV